LRLWNLRDGRCEVSLRGHAAPVTAVAISSDSKYAVSAAQDKTLRVWETASAKCVQILRGHSAAVLSLLLLPGGRSCVSAGADRVMRLWNIQTGECLREFSGQPGKIGAIVSSPDGRFLLSGGVDLRVWEIDTGRCLLVVPVAGGNLTSLALSNDGKILVSAQAEATGILHLWSLKWEYKFPAGTPWHDGARPYLENFLELRRPLAADGLSRYGAAVWSDEDFAGLFQELQQRGYGWLTPEGVFAKLGELNGRIHRDRRQAEKLRFRRQLVDKAPFLILGAALLFLLTVGAGLLVWYRAGQEQSARRAMEIQAAKEKADEQLKRRLAANMAVRAEAERQRHEALLAEEAARKLKDNKQELALRKRAIEYFMTQGKTFSTQGNKSKAIAAYKKVKMLSESQDVSSLLAEVEVALGPLVEKVSQKAIDENKPAAVKDSQGLPVVHLRETGRELQPGDGVPLTTQ